MSKLGCCDKGTVAGKDSVLCTQDSVAPRARFARLGAPRQIHHLNVLPECLMTMRRSLSGESGLKALTVMVI
jgi:hypothetical protein